MFGSLVFEREDDEIEDGEDEDERFNVDVNDSYVHVISLAGIYSFRNEMIHSIMRELCIDEEEWTKFNNYLYVGDKWYGIGRREGYVSTYAMSDYEEDVAKTFRELMTMKGRKSGLVNDDIMMRKFYMLRDLVLKIDVIGRDDRISNVKSFK